MPLISAIRKDTARRLSSPSTGSTTPSRRHWAPDPPTSGRPNPQGYHQEGELTCPLFVLRPMAASAGILSTTKPAGLTVAAATATGVIDSSCDFAKSLTYINATASDTTGHCCVRDDLNLSPALGVTNYQASQCSGSSTPARAVSRRRQCACLGDVRKEQRHRFVAGRRPWGIRKGAQIEEGYMSSAYEVTTDTAATPQTPEGYMKTIIPLASIVPLWENVPLSAASGG